LQPRDPLESNIHMSSIERGPRYVKPAVDTPTWPRLLSLKGAAAYLSVGSRTIEDWVKDGLLDPVPMPGSTIRGKDGNIVARAKARRIAKILIDRCDLDALIEARKGA
jgi:hypothetical protein